MNPRITIAAVAAAATLGAGAATAAAPTLTATANWRCYEDGSCRATVTTTVPGKRAWTEYSVKRRGAKIITTITWCRPGGDCR